MIGMSVGASGILRSDGRTIPHPSAPVAQLLDRVADDVPCVLVHATDVDVRPGPELYADTVVAALATFGAPGVALAVPGWWTPRTLARVHAALTARGAEVLLVNDAEAAVLEHRAAGGRGFETMAVVNLGAQHSGVVLVEGCRGRPTALASPVAVRNEGGDRLDAAVLRHLVHGLRELGDRVDRGDPDTISAARVALTQCRELRETLSTSAVTSLHPDLPGAHHRLRLVRSELDEIAADWADAVVEMVTGVLDEAGRPVEALLLVGGVAAMPLISQRLSADLGLEVLVAEDPRFTTARGAARIHAVGTAEAGAERVFWRLGRRPRPAPRRRMDDRIDQERLVHR